MGDGYLRQDLLRQSVAVTDWVPGDFAEVGVFRGLLTWRLCAAVAKLPLPGDPQVHALDSFQGMDSPGTHDSDAYPKGALCGYSEPQFHQQACRVLPPDQYKLLHTHAGYIPECLRVYDARTCNKPLRWVYVDVDHYQPTVDALEWAWQRLSPGGMLGVDDWFPMFTIGASRAINEFVDKYQLSPVMRNDNNQAFFRKPKEQCT